MMTDSELLRKIIEDRGLKLSKVASTLGISYPALNRKINNKSSFMAQEILKLCDLLQIKSLKLKEDIFFSII